MTGTDIVTLADVKTFLNKGSGTTDDAELSQMISAASQMWIRKVGPVAGSPAYDERYDGGSPTITLRNKPVQSITAVVESYSSTFSRTLTANEPDSGSVGSAWDYTVDLNTGTLTRRALGVAVPFASGTRNVHVTYVAGYSTVPADIYQAVLLLTGHLWQTQRRAMPVPGQPADVDTWNPAQSFTWPRRVLEIAQTYMVPGIG